MNEEWDVEKELPEGKTGAFKRMTKLGVALALALAVGFAGGIAVSAKGTSQMMHIPLLSDNLDATPSQDADFTDFWKVWNVLNTRFVQTHASTTMPDSQAKLYGAIQGLTASFGDPYTVFFPPEESKSFAEQIAGNFGGIGAELGISKENFLTVIAPLKGSPAEAAGLRAGDLIAGIDGKSTDGISIDEAVKLIRGPKGTKVTLTIVRAKESKEVVVMRDTIEVPNIDQSYDQKTGIYYIALYQFTENSASVFTGAFNEFKKTGSRSLIIDLRGNPGGYLDQATLIASHFLPKDAVVVTEDYKGKQQNVVHRSTGIDDLPTGTKMVVLVNQGSASASEILSGALQDYGIATLVGTRSFGKGSVQEVVNIGRASLKVTVARWLTPKGRSISDGGLTPDVKVERTEEDYLAGKDPQRARAVEFFATGK